MKMFNGTRTYRLLTAFACITLLLSSCAPAVKYQPLKTGFKSKSPTEEVLLFAQYDDVPSVYEVIGSVSVGDSGFTLKCGLTDVIEVAKKRAREVGGDAIRLIVVTEPDLLSSCYRITAEVLIRRESDR
jgi:hypothetical protein